jgi:hypothetical protein
MIGFSLIFVIGLVLRSRKKHSDEENSVIGNLVEPTSQMRSH